MNRFAGFWLCLTLILCLTAAPLSALAETDAGAAPETEASVQETDPEPADPDADAQAALSEALERVSALELELAAANDEIARLQEQRDLLLDEVRQFAVDLAVARGEEATPTFDSDEMGLTLQMPTYTRLIPFNGMLHIVSADGLSQAQLSLITNADNQPYTRAEFDQNQIFEALIASWFAQGEPPQTDESELLHGPHLVLSASEDGQTDEVWLFAGETYLYCLEALGESGSVDMLITQIAEGLTTR